MMALESIYLDHAATSPLDPRVAEAIQACYETVRANPESQHRAGRQAHRFLEDCREEIGRHLDADLTKIRGPRLVFTSGGTESNNLAVLGQVGDPPGRIILSPIEHPSVLAAARELQRRGFDIQRIAASTAGVISVHQIERLLTEDTRLVCLMLGNHETGALQPVGEVARLCRARSIPVHCDAVQAAGKLPLCFRELQVSTLSIAAHKIQGPVGIGALIIDPATQLRPILYGGQQQQGLRPGTQSLALAAGMRMAVRLATEEGLHGSSRIGQLRDAFEQQIVSALPETRVNSQEAPRLPHISNLSFPGLDRQAILMALDMAGVACSSGSACASGSSEPSPVLLGMGLPDALVQSALRFSFGAPGTKRETTEAATRIIRIINELRSKKPEQKTALTSRVPRAKPL